MFIEERNLSSMEKEENKMRRWTHLEEWSRENRGQSPVGESAAE